MMATLYTIIGLNAIANPATHPLPPK